MSGDRESQLRQACMVYLAESEAWDRLQHSLRDYGQRLDRARAALLAEARQLADETAGQDEYPWLHQTCLECGIPWDTASPDCPRVVFDRHPRQ